MVEGNGRIFGAQLSEQTREVFVIAQEEAKRMRHSMIGTPHLLLGLIREGSIRETMLKTGFEPDVDKARDIVRSLFTPGKLDEQGSVTARLLSVFTEAVIQVQARGDAIMSPLDLYGALLRANNGMAEEVLDRLRIKSPK